jgi:hypothetical protein
VVSARERELAVNPACPLMAAHVANHRDHFGSGPALALPRFFVLIAPS